MKLDDTNNFFHSLTKVPLSTFGYSTHKNYLLVTEFDLFTARSTHRKYIKPHYDGRVDAAHFSGPLFIIVLILIINIIIVEGY